MGPPACGRSTSRPHRLPSAPCVDTVFLLCLAQLPREEDEGLPDALHLLLEDGTRGGG